MVASAQLGTDLRMMHLPAVWREQLGQEMGAHWSSGTQNFTDWSAMMNPWQVSFFAVMVDLGPSCYFQA